MIGSFTRIMSLRNLKQSSSCSGQIATIMILILVAVLIFILTTANLGEVSIVSTKLSNAADSAALALGSQLATKANIVWTGMGKMDPPQKCKRGGLLGTILAILGAIISITTGGITSPIVAGMVGGAIGGAIGGLIIDGTGTGALNGLLMGAMIGAAVGGGFSIKGATLGAGAATPAGTSFLVGAGGSAAFAVSTLGAWSGALVSAGILYTASALERMDSAAFASLNTKIKGLPEEDRYRESVFLQALGMTVDDPAMVEDSRDSDRDGDLTEKVPRFQQWWDDRITDVKYPSNPPIEAAIKKFLDENGAQLEGLAETYIRKAPEKGPLSRKEIEGEDGEIVELLRALDENGYTTFWKPGPAKEELENWENLDCETCEAPEAYDELDKLISEIQDCAEQIAYLKERDIRYLAAHWKSWLDVFYNPDEPSDTSGDFYTMFTGLIDGDNTIEPPARGLRGWESDLITIRDSRLQACQYVTDPATGSIIEPAEVTNPPCQGNINYKNFATIDKEIDDEFIPALNHITTITDTLNNFRIAAQNLYNTLRNIPLTQGDYTGGKNPVTYSWEDSRGTHSVTVEAGPFGVPKVKSWKSGNWLRNKKCTGLVNYWDDGRRVWIRITRRETAQKPKGILGFWNPYDNKDSHREGLDDILNDAGTLYIDPNQPAVIQNSTNDDTVFSVSRISRVSFSGANAQGHRQHVGISSRDWEGIIKN